MSYVVRVGFDETLRRYFVLNSDVPGLNVETDDFEALVEIVRDVAPDLIGEGRRGVEPQVRASDLAGLEQQKNTLPSSRAKRCDPASA